MIAKQFGLTQPTFSAFLRERVGTNWVIARRTKRILEKYGDSVVCLSSAQHSKIEREYRELYGDPYDPARAAMWTALKAIHAHAANRDNAMAIIEALALGAITLERATFAVPK